MKILFGCEESQQCTIAFRNLGHEAFSCDLKDCSGGRPEWHLKMDVLKAIDLKNWDAAFFFPDCTFITCSAEWAFGDGPYHQKVKPETLVGKQRREAREAALQFICDILNKCERKKLKWFGFENPVGVIPQRIFRYWNQETDTHSFAVFPTNIGHGGLDATQYIQPYNFGEDASKKTGLWLFNIQPLVKTQYVEPRLVNGKKRWANQTDSGQNNHSPSEDRAKNRSKTFYGIAKAMAEQWNFK
jgi:hypothetical protein